MRIVIFLIINSIKVKIVIFKYKVGIFKVSIEKGVLFFFNYFF